MTTLAELKAMATQKSVRRLPRPQRALRQPESSFQQQLTDAARLEGFAVFHPHDSRNSEAGWPDLVLCKPPRLIFAELKADGGSLSDAQRLWLEALRSCPPAEVYVWTPDSWREITRVLKGGLKHARS
jgi:hypothetical protein